MQAVRPYLKDKKHVIWDWNGTLLDDIDCVVDIIGELLTDEGLAKITRDEYLALFGFPVRDYYIRAGFDFNRTSFEALSEKFHRQFYQRALNCPMHPGTRELLGEIKSQGLLQSVLSAAEEKHLHAQVDHHEIRDYFDHIYGLPDLFAASKVERGRELIRQTEISPRETLLIGDTDHDLEVGKALGVEVLLIADGHQGYSRLAGLHGQVLQTRNV